MISYSFSFFLTFLQFLVLKISVSNFVSCSSSDSVYERMKRQMDNHEQFCVNFLDRMGVSWSSWKRLM